VDGGGSELTEGFVGVAVLDNEVLGAFGLVQLSQFVPGPVVLQPVKNRQGKHTTPALIQVRREKIIRMANSSFLEQVGGDSCRNRPAPRRLSRDFVFQSPRFKTSTATLPNMCFIRPE
jgi:hypothetical protein